MASAVTRNRLAAINTAGSLLSWDPNADNSVYALARSGDNIYVGGQFTSVSATTRNRAAAINTAGSLLSWDPNVNSNVFAIAVSGDNVYIGGSFSSIGSVERSRLAVVDTAGSLLSTEQPVVPNETVYTIILTNSAFYVNTTGLNSPLGTGMDIATGNIINQ